jgi:hypothetical protein
MDRLSGLITHDHSARSSPCHADTRGLVPALKVDLPPESDGADPQGPTVPTAPADAATAEIQSAVLGAATIRRLLAGALRCRALDGRRHYFCRRREDFEARPCLERY